MLEVFPQKFMPLSLSLLSVSANYTLDTSDKRALIKASTVLARLAREPSLAPVDADRQMPLLTRAIAPDAGDMDDIRAACALLASDMRTAAVSDELRHNEVWPAYESIAGWRWLRAAHVLLSPRVPEDLRGDFHYLAGIARNFHEADRDRPLRVQDAPAVTAADLEGLF